MVRIICLSAVLLILLAKAYGHGMMCEPRQRGAYVSDKCGSNKPFPPNPVVDYCAHCLNGGTVANVRGHLPPGGWKTYDPIGDFSGSAARSGLCGDPVGVNEHMVGGMYVPARYGGTPIVMNYTAGGYIDFQAEIDTNHNGYFEFFLCDLDACGSNDISGDCFRRGFCHRLQRVAHRDCESPSVNTNYECGPIDEKYPSRWYVPCQKGGHVSVHLVGGDNGYMRYQLPAGLSCRHCVVQWYWATANSCAPRGLLDYMRRHNAPFGTTCPGDSGTSGTFRDDMVECGGSLVPEEFWSCADVGILAGHSQPSGAQPVAASDSPRPDEPQRPATSTAPPSSQESQCVNENEECDMTSRCCGCDMVCARRNDHSKMTCASLKSLYEDSARCHRSSGQ